MSHIKMNEPLEDHHTRYTNLAFNHNNCMRDFYEIGKSSTND